MIPTIIRCNIKKMCDVRYDINLMIGTLLYLWPNGRVNTTQTGGQIMNAMSSKTNLKPDQFRTPRQSSYDNIKICRFTVLIEL